MITYCSKGFQLAAKKGRRRKRKATKSKVPSFTNPDFNFFSFVFSGTKSKVNQWRKRKEVEIREQEWRTDLEPESAMNDSGILSRWGRRWSWAYAASEDWENVLMSLQTKVDSSGLWTGQPPDQRVLCQSDTRPSAFLRAIQIHGPSLECIRISPIWAGIFSGPSHWNTAFVASTEGWDLRHAMAEARERTR